MDIVNTRKEAGISQADLARVLGVHQTSVMRMEKRNLPRDRITLEAAIKKISEQRDQAAVPEFQGVA